MTRIPRIEAEALAERILTSLRPAVVQVVVDALGGTADAGENAEGLSPQEHLRVERMAVTWQEVDRREMPARRSSRAGVASSCPSASDGCTQASQPPRYPA